ncbi:hypothetical protein NDU88_004500 [Pleurodeles waltl]|uniref:Uncharacterized protein n=1 Tax=Pleurodeles waltl TaxID=8319 RepID=A0AAV7VKZ8_PLEWA|nr:hypothetical protein NDU88_004500 [Pleurodeles waltl]
MRPSTAVETEQTSNYTATTDCDNWELQGGCLLPQPLGEDGETENWYGGVGRVPQRDATSEGTGGTEALTQHTEVILAVIQDSKIAFENRIPMLPGEAGLLWDDHNKLKDCVKATEEMMHETTP